MYKYLLDHEIEIPSFKFRPIPLLMRDWAKIYNIFLRNMGL